MYSQACPGKSVVRWTDRPDMTIAVDWDVKNQTKPKQTNHIHISVYLHIPKESTWSYKNFLDQKLQETVFSIAIGRQWQSKALCLTFIDSIYIFDCRLFGVDFWKKKFCAQCTNIRLDMVVAVNNTFFN